MENLAAYHHVTATFEKAACFDSPTLRLHAQDQLLMTVPWKQTMAKQEARCSLGLCGMLPIAGAALLTRTWKPILFSKIASLPHLTSSLCLLTVGCAIVVVVSKIFLHIYKPSYILYLEDETRDRVENHGAGKEDLDQALVTMCELVKSKKAASGINVIVRGFLGAIGVLNVDQPLVNPELCITLAKKYAEAGYPFIAIDLIPTSISAERISECLDYIRQSPNASSLPPIAARLTPIALEKLRDLREAPAKIPTTLEEYQRSYQATVEFYKRKGKPTQGFCQIIQEANAKEVSITLKALRYYEWKGLLHNSFYISVRRLEKKAVEDLA